MRKLMWVRMEMNCHLPQSYVTRHELQALTFVPTQIISPATCKPIISIVQDTLVGAYLFTWIDQIIDQKTFNNLMMCNTHFNIENFPLKGQKTFTGHEVYSTILPDLSFGNMIVNGEFKQGILSKRNLGGSAGGLIQTIYNMYGDKETQRFLDATQDIMTRWLENYSFSVGYGDCIAPPDLQAEIEEIINDSLVEADSLIKKAQLGLFNEKIDESLLVNSMEQEMTEKLSRVTMKIDEVLKKEIDPKNRFKIAVDSGAKGKDINIRQIMGSVGQQIVWNTRITDGFTERTLPHFFKTDYGPAAKGFVKNSYFQGLTPTEFFFHAMAGRTGNIDTAIKTAGTGYISRKLMKTLEDLKVEYDHTVRNANNNIVQFMYGEDSLDPIKLEINKLNIIQYSDSDMKKHYKFDSEGGKDGTKKYWNNFILPSAVDQMMKEPNYQKKLDEEFQKLMDARDALRYKYLKSLDVITNNNCYLPVNFYRLLPFIKDKFDISNTNIPDIDPTYVIDETEKLITKCQRYVIQDIGLPYLEIMIRCYLSSKQILTVYHYNKTAFDFLTLTIHNKVISSFAQYGEMVGPIAAQSIGEPSTQLTLNSVDYEERVLIKEGNKIHDIKIGEFIDKIIDNTKDETLIENHPNDTVLRWTKDTNEYEILSCDEDGNVIWDNIDAVTRHPVVNEDGSDTLVKVTTRMGRTVTATKAKSFLTRKNNKIVPIRGDELTIGDRLPISMIFPTKKIELNKYLDLDRYFPKDKFLHGTELKKAVECSKEEKYWFRKNQGKRFTVPHSRSDSVLRAASDELQTRHNYQAKTKQTYQEGIIYPKKCTLTTSLIPEKLPLDELTGFFFGAYLAEGLATKTYVCISNNDPIFREKIYQFLEKYKILQHTVVQEDKNQQGWTSTDIRIHSTMFAKLMNDTCKTGSADKIVPDFAYLADNEFVKGLLSGYFSGDGHVNSRLTEINAVSVSENLIDGLIVLMSRFGIFARKDKPKKITSNNRGSKNILQHYYIHISCENIKKFAQNITLICKMKQDRLNKMINKRYLYKTGKNDLIPGIKTDIFNGEIHRDKISVLLTDENLNENDREILENALEMPIYFDEIIKIEEIKPTGKYVFDFTTRMTHNFSIRNMLINFDTFHLSGTKANVTEGVPRLEEIISVKKNIKNPIMNIYLKDEYSENMETANSFASQLEYTKIGDLVRESDILYDAETISSVDEDVEFIKTYYEFNDLFCLDMQDVENLSNWVLRIIFDKEQLMNKNVTMAEIQQAILQNITSEDDIQCIFSDDNSGNLVMRIRIRNDLENENYIYFLDEFENSIRNITLRGIPGIIKIFPEEANIVRYNPDSTYTNKKIWKLVSEGSNFLDIMKSDYVDVVQTSSNNITEILEVLGLEAARNAIIEETMQVFASSNINFRHIALLADTMTARGNIMQASRFGVNRSLEYGPIAKASFEEVSDVIINSSIFATKDNMKGVSANITMGQMVRAGTNAFDMLLDEEKIMSTPIPQTHPNIMDGDEPSIEQVDQAIDKMYDDYDQSLMVTDEDFHFGYALEDTEEYDLGEFPEVVPTVSAEAMAVVEKAIKVKKITTKTKIDTPITTSKNTKNKATTQPDKQPATKKVKVINNEPEPEPELDVDETPKKTVKIKKK